MISIRHALLFLTLFVSGYSYAEEALTLSTETDAPQSAIEPQIKVDIIDAFADMHTGPGRGYPIFFTLEQGDRITLIKRKTHWYYAETSSGQKGWIPAPQLARTMKPSGVPVNVPTMGHGEFLTSSWHVGFTTGEFESAQSFSINGGYRVFSWFGAEVEYGEVFANSYDIDYLGANILIEPFSDWVVTPFVSAGAGIMNFSQPLTEAASDIKDGKYNQWGLGLNYYIGFNFVIRGEYRWYSVSTDANKDLDYNEWKLGFSTFF